MFTKKAISKRPSVKNDTLVPAWLLRLFLILLLAFVVIILLLWHPWQSKAELQQSSATNRTSANTLTPVVVPSTTTSKTDTEESSTNNANTQPLDFYHLLRTQQVTPVPDHAIQLDDSSDATKRSSPKTPTTDKAMQYMLQINSFKTLEEADELRAKAVLLGISADILVMQSAGETWYRVFSGPYNSRQRAVEAQNNLQNNSIIALLVERPIDEKPTPETPH